MEDAGIDLEHFVGQALIKIRDGIDQARNDGVAVAPTKLAGVSSTKRAQDAESTITRVEFDVAVTALTSGKTQTGMGIFVVPFGGGVRDNRESGSETISRIRFTVVVDLALSIKGNCFINRGRPAT